MAAKPTVTPRWAQTAGGVPAANITTPSSGQQDTGWTVNQAPPSSYFNFLLQLIYTWVLYLADAIFVATAGSGLAGVSGTGDGAAAGVSGTGGATNGVGVKGQGTGIGAGVSGTGGGTGAAAGVIGTGGAAGADGIQGNGTLTGAGINANGGATGPGVLASAGGATPPRGALALNVQSAATAPAVGDVWMENDGTAVAARMFIGPVGGGVKAWLSKWLSFSGLPGNAASTTYFLAAVANSVATLVAGGLGISQYVTPGVVLINWGIRTSTTTVGGTITVQLWVGGVQATGAVTLVAGTVAGYYTAAPTRAQLTAGATLELRIVNAIGVTTGIGQCVAFVEVC